MITSWRNLRPIRRVYEAFKSGSSGRSRRCPPSFPLSLSRFLAAFHDRKGMAGRSWLENADTHWSWLEFRIDPLGCLADLGRNTHHQELGYTANPPPRELSPRLVPVFPTIVLNFHGGSAGGRRERRVLLLRSRAGCCCERLRANSSGEFCACDFRPWRISKIPRDP